MLLEMGDTQTKPGWWLASDGRWYPPELHPSVRAEPAPLISPERKGGPYQAASSIAGATQWKLKRLTFGKCCQCGHAFVKQGEEGWHNPVTSKVMCTACRPATDDATRNPVPGTSCLSQFRSHAGWNWLRGAEGEYLTGIALHRELTNGEVILDDRRLPGTVYNIDHVVVAQSGVWVLDTKNWSGKFHYGSKGLGLVDRLWVGGEDQTYRIDQLYSYVIPVAEVVADSSILIRPVLIVLADECSFKNGIHFRLKRTYTHNGVMICPKGLIAQQIQSRGPLSQEQVSDLGHRLDKAFPPR